MLVVNRFRVPDGSPADAAVDARDLPPRSEQATDDDFAARAGAALAALAACRGFAGGQLGRAADDPSSWCLVTRWESVGAYRRALGNYQVKLTATPLLAEAVEEPSAFEVLTDVGPDGQVRTAGSDRAWDADTTGAADRYRGR